MTDWKKLDDDQYAVNQVWSAFQTKRIVTNITCVALERLQAATWAWNQLINRNESDPTPVDRRVRIGSKDKRLRYQLWQWAPHILATELTIDAVIEVETAPSINKATWYAITRKGITELDSVGPIGTTIGEILVTWTLPLEPLQLGGVNPYVIYLMLAVESDTDDDLSPLTYNLPNMVPADRDYRRDPSRTGVQYGTTYADVDVTTDFHNIDLYEIEDVGESVPGKIGPFSQHWAYPGRPYEVHLRHAPTGEDGMVCWYPDMLPFPYLDTVGALVLQRVAELTLKSLHVRETALTPGGPMSSPGGVIRATSGSRPAAGIEHSQMHQQQDFLAYTLMPVFNWGPLMPGNSTWNETVPSTEGVNRLKTNFYYWIDLRTGYQVVSEWRIGGDSFFAGDLPNSQRRSVEILPMWMLLGVSEELGPKEITYRLTAFIEDGSIVQQYEVTTPFQPFSSKFVQFAYFGAGRRGLNNAEIRTSFSANGLWLFEEAEEMLNHVFRDPQYINPDPTETDDTFWVRLEVKSFDAVATVDQETWLFMDLGSLVRPTPTWVNDLKTIESATVDV